jgi:hypothetical protein
MPHLKRSQAINFHNLPPRRTTGGKPDSSGCDSKKIGQEVYQGVVRGTFHRRCGEADLDRIPVQADHLVGRGSGLGVDGEPDSAGYRINRWHRLYRSPSTRERARTSSNHATRGLMSNIPSGGIRRRSGSSSQSVRKTTGRIHLE